MGSGGSADMMCKASYVATESMVAYTNITSDMSLCREAEMDGRVTFTPLQCSRSDKMKARLARNTLHKRRHCSFNHHLTPISGLS